MTPLRSISFRHQLQLILALPVMLAVFVLPFVPVAAVAAPIETQHVDRHGDPLPPGAIARLGTQRLRHPAWGLTFSADGRTFATAGHDGIVRLLNVAEGKELRQFKPNGVLLAFNGVTFAPDGKTLFSCGIDGWIRQWNLADGTQVRALPGTRDHPIYSLALRPDEPLLLAMESGGTIHEWNFKEGKETRSVVHLKGTPVALCPDGKHFAVFKDDVLTLRDAADNEVQRFPVEKQHLARLAFSADGQTLAAGCADRVIVWDVKTNKELRTVQGAANSYFTAALSPDGHTLAMMTGATGPVQIVDVASGKELHQFNLTLDTAYVLTFSPDGKILACSGGSKVHFWNVEEGRPLDDFAGHPGTIDEIRFLADGKRLTTTSRYGVVFWWDTATNKPLVSWKGPSTASFRFLPTVDGQSIFYGTFKGLMRCDYNDGRPTDVPLAKEAGTITTCVACSADSKMLAVRASDNVTRFIAVDGAKELGHVQVEGFVYYRAAFSPDGKHLVSGGALPQVSIWDAPSGALVRQFAVVNKNNPRTTASIGGLAYSPDGRSILTLNAEATLWEAASGRERWRAARQFSYLTCGAFTLDGRLAALGSRDGTIYLVETATGAELGRFAASGLINSLDFSPDGKLLASGGDDGMALIWDTAALSKKSAPVAADLKPEQLADLWRDLESQDSTKAYIAVRALAASPQQSIPFLQTQLHQDKTKETPRIGRLIGQLDSEDFDVREKAEKDLKELKWIAVPVLRQALKNMPSVEVKTRITRLLEPYPENGDSPEMMRLSRALEALEYSGTPEAIKLLKALAAGETPAPLAQEAMASLDRLARRTAAP